jgi:hypothetical protein
MLKKLQNSEENSIVFITNENLLNRSYQYHYSFFKGIIETQSVCIYKEKFSSNLSSLNVSNLNKIKVIFLSLETIDLILQRLSQIFKNASLIIFDYQIFENSEELINNICRLIVFFKFF